MSATFRYVPPYQMFALGGSVAGSVDANYQPTWLVDGRTGWPVRKTGTSISLAITGTAQDVDVLCVGHHTIRPAATISITGDITDSITIPTWPQNNIPLNGLKVLSSPTSAVDNLTLAVTGNTETAVIIGEFCAGLSSTLPLTRLPGTRFGEDDHAVIRPIDRAFMPPIDRKLRHRTWTGTGVLTTSQVTSLRTWHESTFGTTKPSLIIVPNLPGQPASDPWFVRLGPFSYEPLGPVTAATSTLYRVVLSFEEYPRTRW